MCCCVVVYGEMECAGAVCCVVYGEMECAGAVCCVVCGEVQCAGAVCCVVCGEVQCTKGSVYGSRESGRETIFPCCLSSGGVATGKGVLSMLRRSLRF